MLYKESSVGSNNTLNCGDPEFETSGFDDFDGSVQHIEYQISQFGRPQIYIRVRPERYEYEKRGWDVPDEDDPNSFVPSGFYSMGNKDVEVSDDGMDATMSERLNANCRAVKLIMPLQEFSGVKMEGGSLRPLLGAKAHWKQITEDVFNPTNEQRTKKQILYPVSPRIGSADAPQVDTEVSSSAVSLIYDILENEEFIRISRIAELATPFEDKYSSDVIRFVCSDEGVLHLIEEVGAIKKVDDRTITKA